MDRVYVALAAFAGAGIRRGGYEVGACRRVSVADVAARSPAAGTTAGAAGAAGPGC